MDRGAEAAVKDGVLRHFSVSQIKDFLLCPRKWAASKIFGIQAQRSPGADRGKKLHKEPERWYKLGLEPTHEAFLAALPGLPARHEALGVELALSEPKLFVEDVRFEGHSDLVVPPELNNGVPRIFDWKFTQNFRWVQDPAEDLQMLTYGYWASKRWPEVKSVGLELWYFEAEGEDFKPRRVVVPVSKCEEQWERVVIPAVQRMKFIVESKPSVLEDVVPAYDEAKQYYEPCQRYGGCSYASRCGVLDKVKPFSVKLSKEQKDWLRAFDQGIKQ